ncbi:EF-hand domain-containing protein [Phyllobacterium sp. K27]
MKRILALALSGTFLTVFALGGAFAQTQAPEQTPAAQEATQTPGFQHKWGARLDTNDDGALDQAEFTNVDRLKEADTDKDGTLSKQEIEAMAMKRIVERQARRMTKRLDINGDGVVTIAEVEKQKAKRFALMDRNDDGKIDKSEMRHGRNGGHAHKMHHGQRHHDENRPSKG